MNEAECLERTRIAMQEETSAAYLSALRVVKKLEAECAALRRQRSRIRKSLRDLNKAHNVLWKVLSLHFEAKRKEKP